MFDKIKILGEGSQKPDGHYSDTIIGERTLEFITSQTKLDDEGKAIVVDEAQKILKHCIYPGYKEQITNIAVGYIQSGKTLSYTTLSTLASDNGYRIIIYLTGITTSLGDQTYSRIRKDLHANDSDYYAIFEDKAKYSRSDELKIRKQLSYAPSTTLLFPIMKHYLHINNLAKMFESPLIKPLLKGIGVLIVDDEADQASFNTYAKKNSAKEDWELDDFSKTYASIIGLRKVFPSLSYIQYTATPQAAFLINNKDILSPKFHTVLSPGKGYCGGMFFFKENIKELIRIIPKEEVYDYKNNPLDTPPDSLIESLKEFVLSVAVAVVMEKRMPYLSMMVHPDGRNFSNEKFYIWIEERIDQWLKVFNSDDLDPVKDVLIQSFKPSYNQITQFSSLKHDFNEIVPLLKKVLLKLELHLVQDGSSIDVIPEKKIEWDNAPAHILIGANILNRGYTVENLSMTYMPRTSKNKATADTIEQRCRFFGYKEKYKDLCRIFISEKSKLEFEDYVDHEEILRDSLKKCSSLSDFSKNVTALNLSNSLNPTRTNILSKKLIRGKMVGWRSLGSDSYKEENKKIINTMLRAIGDSFIDINPEQTNTTRRHRYVKIKLESFLAYFSKIKYADLPNITRKIVTIQYLEYLKQKKKLDYVYLIQMSYALPEDSLRERTFVDGKPNNLFMPHDSKKSLPGDKDFKYEDALTFQLHHVRVKNEGLDYHKDMYNFTVYYPANFEQDFVAVEQEED